MSFNSRKPHLLLSLAAGLLIGLAHGTESCPFPLDTCPAGVAGPGGCYRPPGTRCLDGLLMDANLVLCPRGSYGPGGGYVPGQSSCAAGVIVPAGMAFCPGTRGNGALYPPQLYRCSHGKVEPIGSRPTGLARRASPYSQVQSLPVGDLKDCPAGAKGMGGRYVPGYTACDQGFIH